MLLSKRLVVVLFASYALAQEPAPVMRGTWTATAGPRQTLRGAWSAQALPNRPDSVIGSWTILNDARQIMMEGTWSAGKSARGWQGTWSARVLTGRSSAGRPSYGAPITGTWQTDTPDSSVRTFQELLQRTLEKEIAGSWRRGQLAGYWWINGS